MENVKKTIITTNDLNQNNNYKKILMNGIWYQNPGLVQLLGLCPLLAVSNTAVNALGLGLATLAVLIITNSLVSLFRGFIPNIIRIPIFICIIASSVTIVQLLIQGLSINLYKSLGIFIPLIVTNCIIIGRIEAFSSQNNLMNSFIDAFANGLGLLLSLLALGIIREIISNGTIFKNLEFVLGPWFTNKYITIYKFDNNFILAALAPGAFILLAFLIATYNAITNKK